MLTIKEINSKIRSISRTSAKLRDEIHVVLCNAAGHAYEHGDVTPFSNLFAATSGMNRKLITKWVQVNGFATLQKDGTFKVNKAARAAADFNNGIEVTDYLTNEVAAWYVEEESAPEIIRELDVAAKIMALTKQIQSAKEKSAANVNAVAIREAMKGLEAVVAA